MLLEFMMNGSRTGLARILLAPVIVLLLLALPGRRAAGDGPTPMVDSGVAGLSQAIRKLKTTARMIHTTAHPDDEDSGMLALESRGQGASVLLLTLNRGEGGQNKTGSELFDSLGVLRTLELLAADSYYGVDQRFSRVVDFGFSKTPEETFNQWRGHDIALGDMVRVIRTYRPDVLVARFQGNPRDGHGHHQASGILTREAFKAAADPARFPDQIREGLLPWQARKLYMGGVRANEEYTLKLDTGAYDPALGISYAQIAHLGYSRHLSQGDGRSQGPAGHSYTYYKLLDSLVSTPGTSGGHEEGFFDGIDTTLEGLAARLGGEESNVPFVRPVLSDLERFVSQAEAGFTPDNPARSATPLLAGLDQVRSLIQKVETANLSAAAKLDLLTALRTKESQFMSAANLALGVALEATVDASESDDGQEAPGPPNQRQAISIAVPGQTFTLTARLYNRSRRPISPVDIRLSLPEGWKAEEIKRDLKDLAPGESGNVRFRVTVADNAEYTRPYWHRDNTQEAIYTIDKPRYVTLPLPPPPVLAVAAYSLAGAAGEIRSVATVRFVDAIYGPNERPLAVGPPVSIDLQPSTQVLVVGENHPDSVVVGLRNNTMGAAHAVVRLEAPSDWKVEPRNQQVTFGREGEFNSYTFKVTPASLRESRYAVKAVVEYNGKEYSEGYSIIWRHDLGTFYYYQPSVQRISSIRAALPAQLKVGYIEGAGDDIPETLRQVGINVETISPAYLATGDLSKYDTIVVGIRAYDVRGDVKDNNKRLLDFVSRGGTLVVQYNQGVGAFNAGKLTPYPATATAKRVTVEEAPVEILAPDDSVFHYPNEIKTSDFDGWVQERGVYFMDKWDPKYTALLSSHDPGEDPLQGGLLRASYGAGTYIYTGYAFFRQLPAGVPGAVRLFINIIAAGHQKK
jgi:LmbE family N-acetylglucosaminyl deacetylase